jgi:hypothetical protein
LIESEAEARRRRYLETAELMDSWLSEDSDYDLKVSEQLEKNNQGLIMDTKKFYDLNAKIEALLKEEDKLKDPHLTELFRQIDASIMQLYLATQREGKLRFIVEEELKAIEAYIATSSGSGTP